MANKQELIDQYHSGQMSPEQMIDFEKELASNPELKSESDFQSDIISGLKEVRKAELKTRLNAIDVHSSWLEFAQQSTLIKSFGGVALATLIGSGVYLYADKEETFENQVAIEISSPEPQSEDFNFNYIEVDQTKESSTKDEILLAEKPTVSETKSKASVTSKEEVKKEVTPQVISPDFNAPKANVVEEEGDFESSDLDMLPTVATANAKEIDVTTENVKSVNVKYKYYDGKLFLSGDFDRAPYEILEINSANGRRIYIQYLNTYYHVKTTDKLTNLPEVMDQKLIQELKLLKDNK